VIVGTELYRTQHRELLRTVAALDAELQVPGWTGRGEATRAHLAALSGKLTVHLQMEDRALYPALRSSADPEVRTVAAHFQMAMGGLRASAEACFLRWLRPDAIAASPAAFRIEARVVIDALAERIAAEDTVLYPLVDRPG
jgi:hypothetical protein